MLYKSVKRVCYKISDLVATKTTSLRRSLKRSLVLLCAACSKQNEAMKCKKKTSYNVHDHVHVQVHCFLSVAYVEVL